MARPLREVPWLAKRGGVYYVNGYDVAARETKRLSLRTRDGDEAKGRFAAWLAEGHWSQPSRDARLSVSSALDFYWQKHVVKNCADPRRQQDAIGHLKAHFGNSPLGDVSVVASHIYGDVRRAAKASDSTIRRELNVLIAASNCVKKWGETKESVLVELPPEKRLGPDEEAPFYSRDELELLMLTSGGELHHFIKLAYYTGARRASLEELTRPQVRWPQKQIVLMKAGKRPTKKRQPIVPILPEFEGDLREVYDAAASRGRDRLFTVSDFYRPFARLCEEIGIEEGRRHPHILRHTRATHLLQGGVSPYDVSTLLGDTIQTVVRVYGHHSSDKLVEALRGK